MNIFGKALKNYFEGNSESCLTIRNENGDTQSVPMNVFFRKADDLHIDKAAINLCKGRILDLGAGTGDHALFLQNQGFDITALDISSDSCEIMCKRGIAKVVCCDIFTYTPAEKCDTFFLLGRSIGTVSELNGFVSFLQQVKQYLNSNGQIIFNSVNEPSKDEWSSRKMRFEYDGETGEIINWFDIGENLLGRLASENGYTCEVVINEQVGNYLSVFKFIKTY
jgi:SAM-dependent methyltransferase